jgi:hypothetical protein
MKWSVEKRQPMADERRLGWIIENRSDRLVRAFALKEEDDFSLRQENGVPVESCRKLRGAEG